METTSYRRSLIGVAIAIVALSALVARTQPSNAESATSLHADKPGYTAGETATLTGEGFQPLEAIELHVAIEQPVTGAQVGETSLNPVSADDGGGFAAEYVVPSEADGMMMRATASGQGSGLTATAILNDPAWLDTDMESYPPGAIVYITGGGFYAGETVQLQVLHAGEGYETWTVQADANGFLVDAAWTICEGDCAGALLELTATGLESGLSASARFTEPTVATDKDDYQPGDRVIMTGSGWLPFSVVTLTIDSNCGCTHEVFTASVDENGEFENHEFLIEEKHLGARFLLTAEGQDAQGNPASAQTTFTDAALTLFEDAALTTQRTAFAWGTTVYAQGTGLTAGRCARIEWFEPGNATAVDTDQVVANGSGVITADYAIPAAGPSGIWSARVQNGAKLPPCDGTGYTTTGQQTQIFDVARAVIVGAGSPSSTTADNPGGDNFVAQGAATTVQGSGGLGTTLTVDSRSTLAKRTFLRFDVASLPSSATISDAKVRLWITGFPASSAACPLPRTYELQPAGTPNVPWSEGGITWNLQPGVTGGASTVSVPGFTAGVSSFLRVESLASHVQSFLAGTNHGWRLKDQVETASGTGSTNCFTSFASTENTNVQQRPVLLIDYTTNVCGNGVVESPEQCDLGGANGAATSCCTATCTYRSGGSVCRAVAGQCDAAETCNGSSGNCPVDGFASDLTSCTGSSQGGDCNLDDADHCAGNANECVDVYAPVHVVCRQAAGQCDAPENCTATSGACPADDFASVGTSCTGSSQGGGCDDDAADHCAGPATNACVDVYQDDDYVCRGPENQCDAAETCSGTTGECPTDVDKPDGTGCDDGSACTEDDSCLAGACTGETIDCNHDDTCSTDSCDPSSGCTYECIEQGVSIDYLGDRFVSTSGPTVGSAQVVLAAKITPDTAEYCGDLTDLQVRFRVYAQKDLTATPVANVLVPVNGNGEAVKLLSLTVGNSPYTVRASIVGDECWAEDYEDACLTVDYGSTERRVTGGGYVPSLLSRNEKSNFGLTVGFNKNGSLKGNSIYMVRGTDGFNYLVKSTAWTNGELTFTKDGSGKLSRARFSGKGIIQKIDANVGEVVSSTGNVTFVVDLFDGDLYTPKQRDQYAIRVILQNGTQWWGSSATLQQLGGGNVTIFGK
jgi:hypothetical protein